MMKFLPCGSRPSYITRTKNYASEHPVVTALVIALAAAALVFSIVVIVKLLKRSEEGMLDDEWNLDDGEDALYFYPNEDDFVEGE
ncbi:MAG: hypothetical protein FWE34_03535 [Defluviitaleaceae bacterium]|nr:hypothetical protein [Defluviitaleaceae bacterium]